MSPPGQEGKSAVLDLLAVLPFACLVRLPRLLALLQNKVVDVEIVVVSSFYDLASLKASDHVIYHHHHNLISINILHKGCVYCLS